MLRRKLALSTPWNYKHCVQLEPGGGCHNNHGKAKNSPVHTVLLKVEL